MTKEDNKFSRFVNERAIDSLGHAVYSGFDEEMVNLSALLGAIDREKGKEMYRDALKAHSDDNAKDDLEDGEIKHELGKALADTLHLYPLSAGVATAVGSMNLTSPSTQKALKALGNAGGSVINGIAKSNVSGNEYGPWDMVYDAFVTSPETYLTAISSIPDVRGYALAGTAMKTLAHTPKAKAEELVSEYLRNKKNEEENANFLTYLEGLE